MKVKEESKRVGLKLNIQKMKIMASGPITSGQTDGETVETVSDFIFLGFKITADGGCSHEIKRHLLFGRKVMTNLSSVHFSRLVVSSSLRPHESQHIRPPYPSPSPGVHSDSRPSSPWYHPAISSSVIPFFSCPHPSQHQSLFQWVNSSHEVATVLEFQLQPKSFQWTPRTDLL